jgi:hypothetical protein
VFSGYVLIHIYSVLPVTVVTVRNQEDKQILINELRNRQRIKLDIIVMGDEEQAFNHGYGREQLEFLKSLGVQGFICRIYVSRENE